MEHMDLPILLQTLTDVAEVFTYLGRRLEAAAHALQSTGTPPDKTFLTELMAARQNFADLRDQGYAFASSLGISPLPDLESLTSLDEIKALLEKAAHSAEERKTTEKVSQRAIMVLNRVCALRHSGATSFEPLVTCQARAIALRDEITNMAWPHVHPVAEAIAKEDDAFSALLTIIESGEELDDELCGAFQEVISQEFGNQLAVAALRGKLVFTVVVPSPSVKPKRPEPSSVASPPTAPPALRAVTEHVTDTESTEVPIAESVAVTVEKSPPPEREAEGTATPVVEESLSAVTALSKLNGHGGNDVQGLVAIDPPLPNPLPAAPVERVSSPSIPTEVFYRFAPEERAQNIAALLLNETNGTTTEKPSILRDLVWRLVFEERISLAFHVAQCLEMHYPEVHPRLPAWLLRAVVIGQRLRTPRGEIARTLKEDFARSHNNVWETGNPEWNVAPELLMIAATLVPALLAPETQAATLLRELQVRDYLPHLAAYCDAVVRYSEQGVPLEPALLKRNRVHQPDVIGFVRTTHDKKDVTREAVDALRQELANHASIVADELQLLRNATSLVPVLSGIGVCLRAVEQVTAFFDAEVMFLTNEPLPRPLLNSDLSRIPSLVMNKRGEIAGINHPSFADSILRLVAGGAPRVM